MSKQLYTYLYGGSTSEDVYAEQDGNNYDVDLDTLASPQCAFVAPEYSEQLVEELARDMWDEIAELYQPDNPDAPKTTGRRPVAVFEDLKAVTSSKVAERPKDYDGPLPVKEAIVIDYYLAQTVEPLMKIVVQVRPIRLPNNRKRSLAELLPDFGAYPGDN